LIFLFIALLIPLVSAVRIEQNTTLHASGSNTNLTFDFTFVDADNVTVLSNNISLEGVTCGNDNSTLTSIFYDEANSTRDIEFYCGASGGDDTDSSKLSGLERRIVILLLGILALFVVVVAAYFSIEVFRQSKDGITVEKIITLLVILFILTLMVILIMDYITSNYL